MLYDGQLNNLLDISSLCLCFFTILKKVESSACDLCIYIFFHSCPVKLEFFEKIKKKKKLKTYIKLYKNTRIEVYLKI